MTEKELHLLGFEKNYMDEDFRFFIRYGFNILLGKKRTRKCNRIIKR